MANVQQANQQLTIFGSTGSTGSVCLANVLESGTKVRVLVRDEKKLPLSIQDKVKWVRGDVSCVNCISNSLKGSNAVIVILGTGGKLDPTTELSTGLRNILSAMKRMDIKHISVCLSSFLLWKKEEIPERYNPLTEEHGRMLELLKEADWAEWVAVLPPHISDDVSSESSFQVLTTGERVGRVVSRKDLCTFMVTSLNNAEYTKKMCAVANN